MTLLNPPNILPEAMRFLVRAVVATKGRTSDAELISMVGASGLPEAMGQIHGGDPDSDDQPDGNPRDGGRKIATDSLAALLQLGILESVDESVVLGEQADRSWKNVADVSARSFVERFESALLTERGRQVGADLLEAAAVMFTAGTPLSAFDGFDEGAATRRFVEHQQNTLDTANSENWAVVNIERWRSLRRLGPALGWMAPLSVGRRVGLLPNAAPALSRWLPEVGAGLHTGGEFLRQAATRLPFLDGGNVALRQIGAAGALSGGLSLTLLTLRHSQHVELVRDADASTYEVSLGSDHHEYFSHVKVLSNGRKNRGRS
jgi:hypothetical protein